MSQREDEATPKLKRANCTSENDAAKKILTKELCDTDTEEEMGSLVDQLIDEQQTEGEGTTKKPNK